MKIWNKQETEEYGKKEMAEHILECKEESAIPKF